jgi:hypothetical protein
MCRREIDIDSQRVNVGGQDVRRKKLKSIIRLQYGSLHVDSERGFGHTRITENRVKGLLP